MISQKTKKYFNITLRHGYMLKFYPFLLNNDKVVVRNYHKVRVFTFFSTLVSAYTTLFSAYIGYSYIETSKVAPFFIAITSGLFLCTGLQFWHLRFMKEIPRIIGDFLKFNSKLRKLIKIRIPFLIFLLIFNLDI